MVASSVERFQGLCHPMQNSSKPNASCIEMLSRWVQQVFVKSSDVQWHRQHIETEYCGVRTDEALWDDGDEVRLGHDMQCLQVVRNSQHYLSSVALFMKPSIDGILPEFASNDRNVLHSKKGRQATNLARNRVATSHHAGIAVGK